jgi:ribose transport system permease protein
LTSPRNGERVPSPVCSRIKDTGAVSGEVRRLRSQLLWPRRAPDARASHRYRSGRVLRILSHHAILLTLLLFILGFSLLRPDTFFTVGNLQAILATQALLLLVSLALTIPLAAGDFDLSIGFTLGFTMIFVAFLAGTHGWSWPATVALAGAAGVAIGVVNGFLVVVLGVNAFVTTLGTGTVVSGLTLAVSKGEVVIGVPHLVEQASRREFFGVPLVTYYAFALAIALWYVLEHTPLGRHMLFAGGGRDAARLAGVRVDAIRFGSFVAAAGICGFSGILAAGQIGAGDPTLGQTYLLPAYAAAFLGATTIKPGRFNAWGTVLALFLLATGITGLQLVGAPFWVEPVFNGVALTLAVTFARLASQEPAD